MIDKRDERERIKMKKDKDEMEKIKRYIKKWMKEIDEKINE